MADVYHPRKKNSPLSCIRQILACLVCSILIINGCRSIKSELLPAAVTTLVSYTVEVEINDVQSTEINEVVQLMLRVGAGKSELIFDQYSFFSNCTIRAWFERLSPIGEEKIRYKIWFYLPQSKISIYRKPI